MDLDAAQSQLEEAWRNGWYPNSTVSAGTLLKTMDALIDELRKLREEKDAFEERLEALRQSQWIQLEDALTANEKLREENARLLELEDMARDLWFSEVIKYDAQKNAQAIQRIVKEGAIVDKRRAGRAS